MTDCQHWYDPEIVEREKREQERRVYRLQLRIVQLEDKLRSIRALTEDTARDDSVLFRQTLQGQLEQQRAQAFANSQMRGMSAYGAAGQSWWHGLFGGLQR